MLLATEANAFDAHDHARLAFALQCTRGDPDDDASDAYDEGDERTRANVALLRSAPGGGIIAAIAKMMHGESESVRARALEAVAKSTTAKKKGRKKGRTAAAPPQPNEAKLALLLKTIGGLFIDVETGTDDAAGAAFVLSSAFIAGVPSAPSASGATSERAASARKRGSAARGAHSARGAHNVLAALATLATHAYSRAIRAACVATAKDIVLCTSTGDKRTTRALCGGANAESAVAIETLSTLFIDVVETPSVLLELAELLAFVERAGALDAASALATSHVALGAERGPRGAAPKSVSIAVALRRTLAARRDPCGAATYRFDGGFASELVRVVLEARGARRAGGVAARIAAHAVFSVTMRTAKKEEKIGHGVCYVSAAGLGVAVAGAAGGDAEADDAMLHLAWDDIDALEFTSDVSRSLQLTLRPHSTLLEEWRPAAVQALAEGASQLSVEHIRLEFIAPGASRCSSRALSLARARPLPPPSLRMHPPRHGAAAPRGRRAASPLHLLRRRSTPVIVCSSSFLPSPRHPLRPILVHRKTRFTCSARALRPRAPQSSPRIITQTPARAR